MKYNLEAIEFEKFDINRKYKPSKVGAMMTNEHTKFDSFVYPNPSNQDLFKVVVRWEIVVKTQDLKTTLFELIAEQELILLFDGNEDKSILKNAIATSEIQLQQKIEEKTKGGYLSTYRIRSIDTTKAVDNILDTIGRKL